eukprot:COSAG01_NODE_3384_length_6158_cov_1.609176_1_plen_173_part_10
MQQRPPAAAAGSEAAPYDLTGHSAATAQQRCMPTGEPAGAGNSSGICSQPETQGVNTAAEHLRTQGLGGGDEASGPEDAPIGIDAAVQSALERVLSEVKRHRHAWPFLEPVPEGTLGYADIVRTPIDLSTIARRLSAGEYERLSDVEAAFELMFDNCEQYNRLNTNGDVFLEA